jgi:rubrerythrin
MSVRDDLKPTTFEAGDGSWDQYSTKYQCAMCGIFFSYHDDKLRDEIDEPPSFCPGCGAQNEKDV